MVTLGKKTQVRGLTLPLIIEALVDKAGGEAPLARESGIERYTYRRMIGKSGGMRTIPQIETFDRLAEYLQKLDESGDPLIIDGKRVILDALDLLQLCRDALVDRSDRVELTKLIGTLRDDQVSQLLGLARLMVNGNGQDLDRLLNASTVGNLALALQQNLDIRYPGLNRLEQVRAFAAAFGTTEDSVIQDLMLIANFQRLPDEYYPVLTVLAKELRQVTPKGLGSTFGRDIPAMLRFYGIAE